jgi:hypothetical protein
MVLAKLHHAQVVAKKKNVPIKIILICFFLLPAKENIWAYQNIKYTKDVFDLMDEEGCDVVIPFFMVFG